MNLLLPHQGDIDKAVAMLHDSPYRVVLETTGAGLGLQKLLWDVAGASRTIITASAPYSRAANQDLVGRKLDKSVSIGTARGMAARAYDRGVRLARQDKIEAPIIGLGMTCAVTTDRERKGSDSAILAVRTTDGIFTVIATFEKAGLTRREQGVYCDALGLNMLLWAAGQPQLPLHVQPEIVMINQGGKFIGDGSMALEPKSFNAGRWPEDGSVFWSDGLVTHSGALSPDKHILFPVSANPLSPGHEGIARKVEEMTGKQAVMHVTGSHPVKPTMTAVEMRDRIDHVMGKWPVLTTWGDPRYADKAERFPGFAFVIGGDAVELMLTPEFANQTPGGATAMFAHFSKLGTHFFFAERLDRPNRRLITLDGIDLPEGASELFTPIPGLWDISSTQLRAENMKR